MPYDPQPGDIGCTQIRGEAGHVIELLEWANGDGFTTAEHCLMAFGGGRAGEAQPGGAREFDLDEYVPASIIWVPCPDEYRTAVVAAARAMLGTPYSYLDYGALAAHRLHIPAPGLRAYIGSTHHMICSQWVDEAARRGGWQLFNDGRWAGYVTPSEIARLAPAR
jgi:hypothetical protein